MATATYALNGDKIHRNGKHIATIVEDDITFKPGQQQFKDDVLSFIADLEEEDLIDTEEETPQPEEEAAEPKEEPKKKPAAAPQKNTPLKDPAPITKDPPQGKRKKEKPPEPEQSRQFGDLTPEVVRWRHKHWPKKKFKETYHRRLHHFPDLQD